MIINLNRLQIRVYMTIQEKRVGIGSQKATKEDKHILLWDFDDSKLSVIIKSLYHLQVKYSLPTIYIVASSVGKYHAYSFTARPLREVIHILSDTPDIDIEYLRLGMVRGHYTLRITPRKDENFKLIKALPSKIKNEMSFSEMTVSEYLTSNKGGNNNA